MTEPRRTGENLMPVGEASEDRLRALLQAAYPGAEPNEALERSVAELVSSHIRRGSSPRWISAWVARRPILSAAAAMALLVAACFALRSWERRSLLRPSPGPLVVRPDRRPIRPQSRPQPDAVRDRRLREALAPLPQRGDRTLVQAPPVRPPDDIPGPHGKGDLALPRPPQRIAPPSAGIRGPSEDDMAFISPDPVPLIHGWAPLPRDEWESLEDRVRSSVRVKDDFVQIPFPRLAAASGTQLVAAVESYKREAGVIDPRLFRKVTLALKGASLEDLCAALQAQSGVELRAARSVADDKATLFIHERPAREVMRAIVQVFGYRWLRSKKEDVYRYELYQDLRSQLAEEELRNRDTSSALLALDQQMQAYRPYLDMSVDELQSRFAQAKGAERDRLQRIAQGSGWAGLQLYSRLTPAERTALVSGGRLVFRLDAPNPDRRLPAEWIQPILRGSGSIPRAEGGTVLLAEIPGVAITAISLDCDRSEHSQVTLSVMTNATYPEGGAQLWMRLADGRSPSTEKPDNAAANRDLRSEANFQQRVSLRPESSCERARGHIPDKGRPQPPHVFSSDVWEALHRATSRDIVTDFYTQTYPTASVTVDGLPLFETLCHVADAMGVRWRQEDNILLGRSTRFFWDRLQEVPNRYLSRWRQEKRDHGGLPLDSLIEMASLSDEQLDAGKEGSAMIHCLGLDEWHIVATVPSYRSPVDAAGISAPPPEAEVRYYRLTRPLGAQEAGYHLTREHLGRGNLRDQVRFFGTLTMEQRQRALQPDGLALADLTTEQQRDFLQIWNPLEELRERQTGHRFGLSPRQLLSGRFSVEYFSAGGYYWSPPWRSPQAWERVRPRIAGRTAAEALAAARRSYPEAQPADVRQCADGEFAPAIWIGPLSPDDLGNGKNN